MKTSLFLLVLTLSACKSAHTKEVAPPEPIAIGNGAVFALSIADLDESVRWYTEKLGLEITMRPPKQGKTAIAILEASGWLVELQQHDDALPRQADEPGVPDPVLAHGPFKVGVMVENLPAAIEQLRKRNIPIAFGPFQATASQRANLIIRDNSGNLLQFVQARWTVGALR